MFLEPVCVGSLWFCITRIQYWDNCFSRNYRVSSFAALFNRLISRFHLVSRLRFTGLLLMSLCCLLIDSRIVRTTCLLSAYYCCSFYYRVCVWELNDDDDDLALLKAYKCVLNLPCLKPSCVFTVIGVWWAMKPRRNDLLIVSSVVSDS